MIILFIYISRISSNLKFFFNKKFFTISVIIFFLVIIFSFIKLKITLFYGPNIFNIIEIEIEHNYFLKISLNKLYNKPTNKIIILIINYLLIILFIVVKITNINLGPFRKRN